MAKKTANWHNEMTAEESAELDCAKRNKLMAAEKYNEIAKRLKNRCTQRGRARAAKAAQSNV